MVRIPRRVAELLLASSHARVYPTFAAAARDGTYASELLTRFRVERARLNVESITAADLPPGYALLFAAVHLGGGSVRVTDLGGACGEWAFALRRDARRELVYTVVEHPALAAACTAAGFGWARFAAEPPPACDVFLTSGTLQYLEEPYALLDRAFATTEAAVVLARNGFSERELFRLHRSRLGDNGFGRRVPPGFDLEADIRYPHRTISRSRVEALAHERGWRCALALDSPSGVLPYRGQVSGQDLLFVRR